jgi:hypothetical protein
MKEIKKKCVCCGEEYTVKVHEEDYEKWKDGELVQVAFPYLTADERELFITGICGICFDDLFKRKGKE